MAISVRKETNRVYVITMSGFVTWAESQAVQARAEAEDIFASGQVRVLIRMEEFAGWEPSEQWGDVSFFFRHDADIGRIAVVGDATLAGRNADFSVCRLPASRGAVLLRN